MKTNLMLSVVLAMAIFGCGKSDDDRLVDLEKRIATLEGRLATMERQMVEQAMRNPQRQIVGQRREEDVWRSPLTPEQVAERQRMRVEVRKRLEERRDKARAKKGKSEDTKEAVKK